MKKLLVVLLSIALCTNMFNILAYAKTSTHLHNSSLESNILEINYYNIGDLIVEKSIFTINNHIIQTEKKVNIDNTFTMIIEEDEGKTKEIVGKCDYKIFKEYLEEFREQYLRTGRDIVGKQFKHVKIGDSEFELYKSDLEDLADISAVVTVITGAMSNVPAATVAGLAGIMFNRIARKTPEKMKVIVSTYEVLIKNDNSYYTHCYHSLIKSYNNGKLISTDRDYSQAIGG